MTTLAKSPIASRMKLNITELSERSAKTDFRTMVMTEQMVALLDDPEFLVFHSDVLVATYVRPRKTAGGIIIPEKSVDEDRWQSKVGLVLKLGENAFKTGAWGVAYEGTVPKVGDYITFHTADTREVGLLGFSCRHVDSSLVRMRVPNPDVIY